MRVIPEHPRVKAARAAYDAANLAWSQSWWNTPAGSMERKDAAVAMQRAARNYRIAIFESQREILPMGCI
jgi:hypothetical protein